MGRDGMEETITVAQSLRHARHDFLNELQLIQMYLDLGRTADAQAMIRSHAEAAVQSNRLYALGLTRTEEWLLLSKLRFPMMICELECQAVEATEHLDSEFAGILETLALSMQERENPFTEINCRLRFFSGKGRFTMAVELDGDWPDIELPAIPGLNVRKECKSGRISITATAQMEG
ncbi:MAG TPA: Spo0B domain-containing protein [Planococcus sp. (in: firmicutes)]|nr:Spo0B domain-containing protein [Planococcus sp. (in: firmicutes)]